MKALLYDAAARRVSLGDVPDPGAADLVETLDLLARDVNTSRALLDRAFPLADAPDAFAHASRSSGKVLLEVAP